MRFGYIVSNGRAVRVLHGAKAVAYRGGERLEVPVRFVEARSWEDAERAIRA